MEIEERFAALVQEFGAYPDVEPPGGSNRRRFGSDALKVNGSIFAMVTGGRLVVKLPRDRVEALIANGTGSPFDSGKGRPMKEWVTVADDDEAWRALTGEALAFVRPGSKNAGRTPT
ncbi:MAG: TfoX/Sxy family protein [Actinomycetota bacterium]|nr:TfoX/Sxy family protein [Actinomycetota bacterium]